MPVPLNLRFGYGNKPSPSFVTALVVDGRCYSATSNILSIASNATPANQTAAFALWNPVASGVAILLYGITMTSDTAGVKIRVQHVTADPALGTSATPINRFRQTVLGASVVLAETSIAAGIAIPSTNLSDAYITGIVPILLDDDLSYAWINPGSGILVHFNEETPSTAVNVGANAFWGEFSVN